MTFPKRLTSARGFRTTRGWPSCIGRFLDRDACYSYIAAGGQTADLPLIYKHFADLVNSHKKKTANVPQFNVSQLLRKPEDFVLGKPQLLVH